MYKITNVECVSHTTDMLEDEQGFLHAIFLISKFNYLSINEVYVRIIIDKYQSFLNRKLMLISYSLNPVLVINELINYIK